MPLRDLLLLGIIVGLVPVILRRPWVGVLAWFWIGLMAPHRLTWDFMFDFPVAMVIAVTTLGSLLLTRDRQPLPITREVVMIGLFAAYVTMTSFFAVNPGAWSLWEKVMKILLMTLVTPFVIYGQRRIVALLLVMTFSVAFYGFKGGLFAVATGGQHMVLGPRDSFLEGNTLLGLAMIMVLPSVLVSARLFYRRWIDFGIPWLERWHRAIGLALYGVFWLTALAILATYSRGAFLGILLIGPFLFWHMRRKSLLVATAVFMIAVVGVTVPDQLAGRWETITNYTEDTSAMQRIQAWGVNWNIAVENPLTGAGFSNAGAGYDWWIQYANFEGTWDHALSAHSIYFQVLGHHGFGGLAVFLLMTMFAFLSLNRIRRRAGGVAGHLWLSEYAWALQVGLVGFLGAGAFLDVAYFDLYYAFLALVVIMRRELEEGLTLGATEADGAANTGPRPVRDPRPGLSAVGRLHDAGVTRHGYRAKGVSRR